MMIRNCLPCTECCNGCVETHVNGEHLHYGKPCSNLTENGCGIGDDRPQDPCKAFNCGWKVLNNMPYGLRPDKSGVIVLAGNTGRYLIMLATRDTIDFNVKKAFSRWAVKNQMPIVFKELDDDDGEKRYYVTPIGHEKFISDISEKAKAGIRI